MATEKLIKIIDLSSKDTEKNISAIEQEVLFDGSSKFRTFLISPEFESTLNRLSKWVLCVVLIGVLLWRHDAEAAWTTIGSVLNSLLSITLKRILNHDRPIGNLRSDPGMPSNHGQSIFYAVMYFILSTLVIFSCNDWTSLTHTLCPIVATKYNRVFRWQGVNKISVIFAIVTLALGSYLSWLRVSQRFHTLNQVIVGAILGLCFSVAWFWSWNVVVSKAFNSNMLVQVSILVAFATCCLALQLYIIFKRFRKSQCDMYNQFMTI